MAQVLMVDSGTPQEDIQAFQKITREMENGTVDKIVWFSNLVTRITALESVLNTLHRNIASLESNIVRLEKSVRHCSTETSENKRAYDSFQNAIKYDRSKITQDLKVILAHIERNKNEMEARNKKNLFADAPPEEPAEIV